MRWCRCSTRKWATAYPELHAQRAHIERVLRQEEERFAETLAQGMALLDGAIGRLSGKQIPGETVFRLYDTFGFPLDLTNDIARERGFCIDEAGFEAAMDEQRSRARAASKFGVDQRAGMTRRGPDRVHRLREASAASVASTHLFRGTEPVQELRAGDEGQVVLDSTPFYAESGGQVGDRGVLVAGGTRFVVADTQKLGKAHVHVGRVESGALRVGDAGDGGGRSRAAPGHAAQPHRDPPAARCAAQGARHPRRAEGFAGVAASGCASTSRTTRP